MRRSWPKDFKPKLGEESSSNAKLCAFVVAREILVTDK